MTLKSSPPFGSKKNKLPFALIIPYRDREEHLRQFVPFIRNFLKDLSFQIYVIEQADDRLFNRGKLKNIGFALAKSKSSYICMHDVDMLPLKADYSAPNYPTHLATAVEQFDYDMPYPDYFGGVLLFTQKDFEAINGFYNDYWGWGLEDDDLRMRCMRKGLHIESRASIYTSLPHPHPRESDQSIRTNRERFEEYAFGNHSMEENGLTTLKFEVVHEKREGNLFHYWVKI